MAQKPNPPSSAVADSISGRFKSDLTFSGDKHDLNAAAAAGHGSPVSPFRHPRSSAATQTSSSSSSSGSSFGKPANNAACRRSDPDRNCHSGEISGGTSPAAPALRPSHRRSDSSPLVYSGGGGGGGSTASSSPVANVLPSGNICPSGMAGKTGMMAAATSPTAAGSRSDVLGTGTGRYGHGSVVRGTAAVRSPACTDPAEIARAGNEHYKRSEFSEALRLYDRAVAMSPENASCRSNRAAALAALGRLGEAVVECEVAARLDPSNARVHHRLAVMFLRLGHVETARHHLMKSGRNPDPVELHKLQDVEKHLGKCSDSRKVGDWKGALRDADAAIAAGADASPLIAASRAEALLRLNRFEYADSAMSNASKLAMLAPPCPQISFFGLLSDSYLYIVQAQAEMAMGRFENAVASAERARQIDRLNAEATLVLDNVRAVSKARTQGNAFFNAGKIDEASIAYGEGLKFDPFNPVLYCNRAACRFKLEEWEKSIEDCNEALKIQPSYNKALLRRAASYEKLERWAEAVRDYGDLRKALPDDTSVRDALFYAEIALKASLGEDVSNIKYGGEVEKITSLEQFQSAISLPGVSVVHFMSPSNMQSESMCPFFDKLCGKYPTINFLKVDIGESPAIAKSENVRIVSTFKIYKNGARAKEMVCPTQPVLESSVRHYSL